MVNSVSSDADKQSQPPCFSIISAENIMPAPPSIVPCPIAERKLLANRQSRIYHKPDMPVMMFWSIFLELE